MVSNKAVLCHANTDRNLMWNILSRQLRFVGHVLRKEKLEEIGHIEGKRSHYQDASDSNTYIGWRRQPEPRELIKSFKIRRYKDIMTAGMPGPWHGTLID